MNVIVNKIVIEIARERESAIVIIITPIANTVVYPQTATIEDLCNRTTAAHLIKIYEARNILTLVCHQVKDEICQTGFFNKS